MTVVARAGLVALTLAAAAGCSSSNDAGPATAVDPVALYAQNCARCHGADGKGDAELKKTMPVRDFTDPQFRGRGLDEIERVIMAGMNQMPPFGGALSQTKIQHLAGYVKRLSVQGR